MQAQLTSLLAALNRGLIERDAAIKAALLAALAGENVLFIGPPGTAKSLLARRISRALGEPYFEYLLTKFTTPDELFGPLSITALKADRFERKTEGYLPAARVAFLDEIFKANSSILNALLTILNERTYHNGADRVATALETVIAASNEIPTGQEELAALYDRFIVRIFIDGVSDANWLKLLDENAEADITPLPAQAIATLRQQAGAVHLPPEVATALQAIWRAHREAFKEDARERLSDRRLKKILRILKISAAANGRREVDLSDLFLLKDCLWSHPDNADRVREIIHAELLHAAEVIAVFPEQGEEFSTMPESQPNPSAVTPARDPRFKGYAGQGTAENPLRIETVDDLAGLSDPEIGQRGYHFLQTADIDASHIATWPHINFRGVYDGGGHRIIGNSPNSPLNSPLSVHAMQMGSAFRFLVQHAATNGNDPWLHNIYPTAMFRSVSDSTVRAVGIENFWLFHEASASQFIGCELDTTIGFVLRKCKVEACISKSILAWTIEETTIRRCEANGPLVLGSANNSVIEDCLAIHENQSRECPDGGIASRLADTEVRRSYVAGNPGANSKKFDTKYFSGIARTARGGLIERCAIGDLKFEEGVQLENPVAACDDHKHKGESISNVVLDRGGEISGQRSIVISSSANSVYEYEPVDEAIFNQRLFEHRLRWDFESVWCWNETAKRPALRSVGISAAQKGGGRKTEESRPAASGVLRTQIESNLWA